ncbi:hypothetical protein BGZ80_000100 [Entomortierella chlamydospora]|uniref:RING-type E3 ubiquitin transferase n=1 Tax=Entomortierella chlamydospora TaxID=101097 RepID=A0A9P6MTE2_9FUNG|nr:hypothetical protein BGZ80_000100 [Entomortierella chlamydospora]
MYTRTVYSAEMPETIPRRVLIGRAIENVANVIRLILRGILVALIWFVMLPYFTIWIWRLYFWIGESFAFRLNGLETPLWNSSSFFTQTQNITAAVAESVPTTGAGRARDGISQLILQSVAPEYQWISMFVLDCFEGQIISSVVVVVFVAIFLLREWVVQNQREGVVLDDAIAPLPGAEPDARGFNVEHAVERFIAVQHHIEAVVEGEADLSDDDDDDDDDNDEREIPQSSQSQTGLSPQSAPVTEPWNLMDFGTQSDTARSERSPFTQEQRPRFFWDVENAGEGSSGSRLSPLNPTIAPMGSWDSESTTALGSDIRTTASIGSGVRPSNERTSSADPTTGIYASTPTVDRSERGPGVVGGRINQGISFKAPQDVLPLDDTPGSSRAGYLHDPLSQTYHPGKRRAPSSVSTPSASTTPHSMSENYQNASSSNWTQHSEGSSSAYNGEGFPEGSQGSNKDPIYAKDGEPLYWKEGIPLTYENVYLNEDGSEMSLSEKVSRYDDLCRTGALASGDIRGLPPQWQLKRAIQPHVQPPEQTRQIGVREGQRQEMIRQINERGIQARLRNRGAQPLEQNPVHAANPPPPQIPQAPPAVVPAPPAPAPALDQDDELEEFNVDEIDGILEVIGMRGSFWLLLQNSLLMSALVCASLGVGIWIPFMIGKTILLMNPLNILRLPHALLSRLTDPILDYIFDRMLPYASGAASRAITGFNTKLWPHIAHIAGSYLGTAALKPLGVIYEDHILPTLNAILEISVSGANQGIHPKIPIPSAEETLDLGESASNATSISVVHHAVRKWTDLAYGSTSGDKFVAIMIGYAVLFGVASWYLARTRYSYGHTFTKTVRDFLSQQGYILKIAFFVSIEMILFPLFCGVVIGFSTLPLFKDASFTTRIAFYRISPFWSLVMHWFVGTAFLFNFSYFIGICRGTVRPGVLWFIRDPNDEGFHPIREFLERPVLFQLRKLCSGAVMYFTLIIFGITLTVQSVNLLMRGVLPLRWPVDEPISDLPIDLLLFHLVFPLTARWLNPTALFKALFEAWWRKLSHWLRLSSFMYASDGRRFYDEEGYFVYRSWKAWILRWRPPIPGMENADDETGSGEELDIDAPVIFVRDGDLLRVPNTDRIYHLKDRRVLVPVDENGNALDPSEDLPGEIDPLAELQNRQREGLINPKENTIIIYAPPHFKRRLSAFIVLLWISVTSFLVLSVIVPMVLGRAIFQLKTDRQVHDIYSILVGVYVLCGLWYLVDWVSAKVYTISSQGLQPIDFKTQINAVWSLCRTVAKLIYFGLAFGIIIPFALGLMIELFIILPLRASIEEKTSIIFVVNWAVGLLYMKIVHRVLSAMPNLQFAIDLNRVFVGANVNNWDTNLATRRLIIPVLGTSALMIGGPLLMAWITVESLDLTGAARLRVFRQSYPVAMMASLVVFGLKESLVILRSWSQHVRDQEYLVGRQLHNLQEDESEQQQQHQQQQQLQQGPDAGPANEFQQEQEAAPVANALPRLSSVEVEDDSIGITNTDDVQDVASTSREEYIPTKEPEYAPPLLRSNSRLVRDPPLASELGYDDEGESIAQRTRLRRSRRLQAQEALHGGQSSGNMQN